MEQRLDFFDSNVLIAASISTHTHHIASAARLKSFQSGGAAFAAHSLAEAYNNLTNIRSGFQLSPTDALVILEYAAKTYNIVTLTAEETMAVLTDAAQRNLDGAIVYDALLLGCARKARAHFIYTWNVKHFRRVAPDLADRIVEP